jgi:hypothetical protein
MQREDMQAAEATKSEPPRSIACVSTLTTKIQTRGGETTYRFFTNAFEYGLLSCSASTAAEVLLVCHIQGCLVSQPSQILRCERRYTSGTGTTKIMRSVQSEDKRMRNTQNRPTSISSITLSPKTSLILFASSIPMFCRLR